MRAHGEAFTGIAPANTTYLVAGFIPDVLVEIELDAIVSMIPAVVAGGGVKMPPPRDRRSRTAEGDRPQRADLAATVVLPDLVHG